MKTSLKILLSTFLIYTTCPAYPDMISMRDYIQLKRGMSEAEVLYRVGPYDHETMMFDYQHNIQKKTWYYIPAQHTSNSWITEITFNRSGIIQSLERYPARR